jgi:hypothetical protein
VAEIETKLICIEGMPGFGKSETAHFLTDLLADSGTNVSCFDENDLNHPADYTFHAFMKDDQVKSLSSDEQRQLYAEGKKTLTGLIVPLTQISVSLFGKVIPFKIYDNLGWETEKPVMLEQWQSFAKKAQARRRIHIFSGCVLQNPVNEMMMRFDFGYPVMYEYVFNLYRSIAALHPLIVYIKRTDIRACVEEESHRRNSYWLSSMIDYHTAQGYGKRNGMTGLEGYIDCLEARQRIELKLLGELPAEKLILADPLNNWTDAKKKLSTCLEIKSAVKITG